MDVQTIEGGKHKKNYKKRMSVEGIRTPAQAGESLNQWLADRLELLKRGKLSELIDTGQLPTNH